MTVPVPAASRPGAAEPVPAVVILDLWQVPTARLPLALVRMAVDRGRVRGTPGLRFAKLLGTGSGRTFSPRDADLRHWAVLTVWDDDAGSDGWDRSPTVAGWRGISDEHARFTMRPLSARGRWSGRTPFGDPVAHRWDGPVAVMTRARIRPSQWRRFWSAVPPVSADLQRTPGLALAVGIGEAPVGLQGTFSVWRHNRDVTAFAHRRAPHAEVVRRTEQADWYAEELFARFALVGAAGVALGRPADRLTAAP